MMLWFFLPLACAFDMMGWVVNQEMGPKSFPFDLYSHAVVGKPIVSKTGVATCNTSDVTLKEFVKLAHEADRKVIWHDGLPPDAVWHILLNQSWADYKAAYLNSIGKAVSDCGVDGIEFDYECPNTPSGRAGIVSPLEATKFTELMAQIKSAMGPSKQIGCDMGVWGVTRGSYPLMFEPWVNVSMVKAGAIDYINTMSYHYPGSPGDVFPWEKDGFILTKIWGLPKDKINIGLPYFFHNGTQDEVTWAKLSALCPNIDPKAIYCVGIRIISKEDNLLIGEYINKEGYRGAFPWAADYDSFEFNNTLAKWLFRGMNRTAPKVARE